MARSELSSIVWFLSKTSPFLWDQLPPPPNRSLSCCLIQFLQRCDFLLLFSVGKTVLDFGFMQAAVENRLCRACVYLESERWSYGFKLSSFRMDRRFICEVMLSRTCFLMRLSAPVLPLPPFSPSRFSYLDEVNIHINNCMRQRKPHILLLLHVFTS